MAEQRSPVQLHQLRSVVLTRQSWRRWRCELAAIHAIQIERQTALRIIQCARSAEDNRFEIRGVAAIQGLFERFISHRIYKADGRLSNSFRVGPALVGITSFVSVVNLRRRRN